MKLHHLLISCTFAALPAAAARPLAGLWSFETDSTVIEFITCGDAVCATVRSPPPKSAQPAEDLKCGQVLMDDMKPYRATGSYRGWVVDPATQERYTARLEPDAGTLKLVVSAMGGLVNETYRLRPVTGGAGEACKP